MNPFCSVQFRSTSVHSNRDRYDIQPKHTPKIFTFAVGKRVDINVFRKFLHLPRCIVKLFIKKNCHYSMFYYINNAHILGSLLQCSILACFSEHTAH